MCQVVKKRVCEKKNCALSVFVFFMLEEAKEKTWKNLENKNVKKAQKNSVFGVVVKKWSFFGKMSFFRKIGQHYLCSEGHKKSAHFRCNYLFWENGPFFVCPFKVTKHYKNRGFSRHGGKPKMALLVAKVPFWVFPRKGVYYLWYTKAVLCWKHLFIVFSAKHSFVDMKECNLKKNKNLPKIGAVCQNAKRFFWGMFFLLFGGFVFLLPLFLCLCFVKRPQKAIFLQV